jgi:hypothetical protein
MILGLSMAIFSGCKKDATEETPTTPPSDMPTLTTSAVSSIGSNTAICGGTITAAGASAIIASGVCWNTSPNPTPEIHSTFGSATSGSYTSNITGLLPNTLYYVRAYAANNNGFGYGNELTFTTTATPTNSFSATVDGVAFNPTGITVNNFGGKVGISGMVGSKNLILWLVSPPTVGSHSVSNFGDYVGQYSPDGSTIYTSSSGTINITEYNSLSGKIKGTFSFVANYNSLSVNVTNGQFTVYE